MEILEGYEHLDQIMELFRDYQQLLGVNLDFQGFSQELAGLPGHYATPWGRLYLVKEGANAIGCIALKQIDDTTGEIKRLYVKTEARGQGIAACLLELILQEAKLIGYKRVILDTLSSLQAAVRLYQRFGFHEIPPYYHNPLPDVLYFEKIL